MAEVGSAFLSILPSAKGFGPKLSSQVAGETRSAGRSIGAAFGKMFVLGASVIAAAGVGRFLKGSIEEAREAQKTGAATAQIIKTTGGAAKITADQVSALANAISLKTGIDDEAIQSGQNMLLTFKNVRNEVGKGADIFDRASKAAIDLSSLKGMAGIEGSSKALGKALQDPIKGIAALSRGGVTFTEQQKEQITAMQESGNILGAQKLILGEVEGQVGGLAAAQATFGEKAKVAYDNIKESIGTALLPALDGLLKLFVQFTPAIQSGVAKLGPIMKQLASAVEPVAREFAAALLPAVKQVFGFFNANRKVLAVVAGVFLFMAAPVVAVGIALALLYAKSQTVRDGFAALVVMLQNFGHKAAPVVAAAFATLVEFIKTQVIPFVQRLAQTFVTVVLPAITSLVSFLISKLVPIFVSIVGIVRDQVLPILLALANFFVTKIIPAVVDVASSVASSLKPVLEQLFATFQTKVLPAVQQLLAAFQRAQPTIQKVVLIVLKVVGAVLKMAAAVLGKVLPVLIRLTGFLIGTVVSAFIGIVTVIVKVISKLIDFGKGVANAATAVGNFVKKAVAFFAKLPDAVREKITNVVNKIKELPGKMLKGLGDLGKILYDAGRKIIEGLIKGLLSKLDDLKAAAGKVTGFLKKHKGPPSKDKVLLVEAGRLIMGGLIDGIESQKKKLGDVLEGVTKQVTKAGDKMSKKTKELVEAATQTLKDRLSTLRDTLSSISGSVTSNLVGNLFESTSASDFLTSLTAKKAELTQLMSAFKVLQGWGLPAPFLSQLFAQGGGALILDLAKSQATATQAAALFGDVTNLGDKLGGAVAENEVGKKINETNKLLKQLLKATGDQAQQLADAIQHPAKNARRRAKRA